MNTILFSGGITLGPVMPLVAVIEHIKKYKPEWRLVWIGTKCGPEKNIIKQYDITYYSVRAAKLRRYFSIRNFLDIFNFLIGLIQSFFLLIKIKPKVIVTAGSSVSVPIHWIGKLFRIPSVVHQQDVRLGLANILMADTATKITCAMEVCKDYFGEDKTTVVGNPVRAGLAQDKETSRDFFGIPHDEKVILFLGGGTGAMQINRLVTNCIDDITRFAYVIHLTGDDYFGEAKGIAAKNKKYIPFDFLTEDMGKAYGAADLTVCRAGFSTLTELSYLGKAAALAPIKGSHQVENAKYFSERGAVILINEEGLVKSKFAGIISDIMKDENKLRDVAEKIKKVLKEGSTELFVDVISGLL